MRHLMTDNGADSPVVDSIVGGWIEERRLQDASRKDDFVELWIVVSIDGWRRHAPFRFINGFANLRQIAPVLEGAGLNSIGDEGITSDVQRRVIAPLVRVANLVDEGL